MRPATAEPIPTARKILSGVPSALFIARRIHEGLAANNRPSSTNRIPTPMRKSANAMDLIGRQPPRLIIFFAFSAAKRRPLRGRCRLLLRRRRGAGRPARRAAEEAEEIGVRPQQETGV